MSNTFVTDQFNKTKITGCSLESIQNELEKYICKNCEIFKTGGKPHARKK